jgi:lysophospholipase L1-like esterase
MLGTNDSKDFNRSRYVGDFRRTIEALGSSHIIIMSPPLVLAERYGINSAIVDGAVPNAAREVAAAVGAHFFDLHREFTAAVGYRRTPAYCAAHFMPDGIHTNEKGTALIAKLARHALDEVLPPPALTS